MGVILRVSLSGNARLAIFWWLALSFFGFYAVALVPDARGLQQYGELLESFGALTDMMGINQQALSSAEGFIGFIYLEYSLLYLSVFAALAGLSVSSGEEESGMLDWQLSLPVSRARFLWERSLAFLILFAAVCFASSLITWLTALFREDLALALVDLLAGALNFLPTLMLVFALTLLISVVIRRRALAIALVGFFIGISFFFNGLGEVAGGAIGELMFQLSYFSHYQSNNALLHGLDATKMLLTTALTLVFLLLSTLAFQRRDIGI